MHFPNAFSGGRSELRRRSKPTFPKSAGANVMHLGADVTAVDTQPARERDMIISVFFYLLFIIFGVLFATNVFVGVVIDEFNRIRRVYDGNRSGPEALSTATTPEEVTTNPRLAL